MGSYGLPKGLDFQRGKRRNPLLCQPVKVSGFMFTSAPRHGKDRLNVAIVQRVESSDGPRRPKSSETEKAVLRQWMKAEKRRTRHDHFGAA